MVTISATIPKIPMKHYIKMSLLVALGVVCLVAALMMGVAGTFIVWGFLIPIVYTLCAGLILLPWGIDSTQAHPTVLKRPMLSPLFIALLIGAGLLVLLSLLYQVRRDYQERSFAGQTNFDFQSFEVRITYPEQLWRGASDQLGQPLLVELVRAPASATPNATVVFTSDDPLVFTDFESAPMPNQITLSSDSPLGMLYLKPAPIIADTKTISLAVNAKPSANSGTAPNKALAIMVEGSQDAWWRLVSERVLGDAALLLGIAAAIASWAVEANSRRRDERKQQQQALVESILETVATDPPSAIATYQAEEQFLAPEQKQRIQALLLNDDVRVKLLLQAGEHLEDKKITKLNKAVDALCKILSDDQPGMQTKRALSTLASFVTSSQKNNVEETARAIQKIYTTYAESRQMCVGVARKLFEFTATQTNGPELAETILRVFRPINSPQFMPGWEILLDEQIFRMVESIEMPSVKAIANEISQNARHSWPIKTVHHPDQSLFSPINAQADHWWKCRNIKLEHVSLDRVFEKRLFTNTALQIDEKHLYIHSNDSLLSDLIVSDIVEQMCGKDAVRPAMPVELWLPLATIQANSVPERIVYALAQAIGERWLTLVCTRPEWFFNLRPPEQRLVLRLIAWAAGSYEHCSLTIEGSHASSASKQNARTDADRRLMLYELRTLFANQGCPNPSPAELRSWLRLRPNRLTRTLVVARFEQSSEADADVAALAAYAPTLEQEGFQIVLCGSTRVPIALRQIDLAQQPSQIKALLDELFVIAAGTNDFSFDDLLSRSIPGEQRYHLVDRLAGRANGSLSMLVGYVGAIATHHARRYSADERETDPTYDDLMPEDFDVALSTPGHAL